MDVRQLIIKIAAQGVVEDTAIVHTVCWVRLGLSSSAVLVDFSKTGLGHLAKSTNYRQYDRTTLSTATTVGPYPDQSTHFSQSKLASMTPMHACQLALASSA